ncbi:SRPBCC family protein [Sandaracinobacter sp. RS1-74]|uniref:SRPBCC family protein n=1 Tax=Sandaracinobacteroides sayramensis TaxID=2913411 RepID=UPI001EDA2E24|nr:SRPBCC family protein [Sandaracinobacteroides sayramensis]MCG2842625.1 SRPBCC family protein [Sandaracinobacteroides sayramensis]
MGLLILAERIEAPADAVWRYVGWHGVAELDQYSGGLFRRIEFHGDEPSVGIVKIIHPIEGLPIHERMDAFDAGTRTYRYSLLDVGSLPVTDYRGLVKVTPAGPDACHLKIECQFTAVGVTEEAWSDTWFAMERGLLAEIRARVEKAPA